MTRLLPLLLVACPAAGPVDTGLAPTEPTPTPPPIDTDGDGFTDDVDNCFDIPNPDQADLDGDLQGDACDVDVDGDFVPDAADLFPTDGTRPGRAAPASAYAHTADTLYRFDVATYAIETIGTPNVDGGTLTDLAIDRYGVLYAITFDDLYTCHPQTAECWFMASLDSSSNGLTFIPEGQLDADADALVGISQDGVWSLLTVQGSQVTQSPIGGYGPDWTSSGDVFSLLGTGTFAAVDQGVGDDTIVEVDPATGAILATVTAVPYSGIWGIAGWENAIFAFDSTGDVLLIDPDTGTWDIATTLPVSWYGAGVQTTTQQPSF